MIPRRRGPPGSETRPASSSKRACPRQRRSSALDLTVVADGRHPVPTALTLQGDGGATRTLAVPPVDDVAEKGGTQTVTIPFEPLTSARLRVVVDAVRDGTTNGAVSASILVPVSIAEAGLAGVPVPAAPSTVDIACRSDLVRVDGRAVAVRVSGLAADACRGLSVDPCDNPFTLEQGSNTLRTVDGLDTGIDLDRLVLSSDTNGQGTAATVLGAPLDESGARVRITDSSPDSYDLDVRTDGTPFWIVLGESHSDGWEAEADGESLGSPQLVNGFANGWLVRPTGAGTMAISLHFAPQRYVWIGIGLSIAAVIACIALVVVAARRRRGPRLGRRRTRARVPARVRRCLTVGASPRRARDRHRGRRRRSCRVGGSGSSWAWRRSWPHASRAAGSSSRPGAPLALALGKLFDTPELGWLAIGLLGADLVTVWATSVGCGPSGSSRRTAR